MNDVTTQLAQQAAESSNGNGHHQTDHLRSVEDQTAIKTRTSRREQIANFIRVGDEYFEKVSIPDKHGRCAPQLVKRNKDTIKDDFGKEAIGKIKKYKAFCLVPSHTDFQQVVNQCYNNYQALTHQPAPGGTVRTIEMLTHVFGDKIDVALDYLQLLFCKPTQPLPIICLVSRERNTGKSTFGQWLCDIFQNNAVKLGNADISNEFNTTYSEKLAIVIEEAVIEKRIVTEAVKRMSTEKGKIIVNPKGRQQYAVEFIGKFIFISNDEEKFMQIQPGETRFFVVKVPVLQTENVNMMQQLKDEIPAFLHLLQNRQMVHSEESRMYFPFEAYQTEQLQRAIEANRNRCEQAIRKIVTETFQMFPDQDCLHFAASDLLRELADECRWIDSRIIRDSLKDDFKVRPLQQRRYDYHSLKDSQVTADVPVTHKRNGTPYRFMKSAFPFMDADYEQDDAYLDSAHDAWTENTEAPPF